MTRMRITTNNGIQITIERGIPQTIIPENAKILAVFYEKLAQNFLDILILKKLKEKQMRLCELRKSLRKEAFISIDLRKLHKRIKGMEKEEIIKTCEIGGRKFYSLTSKGRRIIEILQKQHCQINEIVQNIIT